MELIIIIISLIAIITILLLMSVNFKKMEKIAIDENLNNLASKYPSNLEICRDILKKLDNEKVKIEEDKSSDSTLYIALQDKISIGNTHESFTRIQTMAHECLHSVQDRKLLLFNFIYSNIYFLYFIIICILVIIKKLPNEMLFSNILLIMSFIYYVVRVFLENDAMIKAEFLAKDYLIEKQISNNDEISMLVKGFKDLNKGCIKGTNCNIFVNIMIKFVVFNLLALIF